MDYNPIDLIRPNRKITGISAILLPFTESRKIDWAGLGNHILRTAEAGLTPAVNMDTGYANLISEAQRQRVLELTHDVMASRGFVAGAFVADEPGASFDSDAYNKQIETIQGYGGTPIIFPVLWANRAVGQRHCRRLRSARPNDGWLHRL